MYSSTSLWVIAILMSSILQAHAGRPSSPAPQQPQQSPAPANTPDTNPSSPTPANTPQGSGPTTVTDNTSTTPQPGFLSTPTGQATAIVGGLATLGVGAIAAKKGYNYYQQRKAQKETETQQLDTVVERSPNDPKTVELDTDELIIKSKEIPQNTLAENIQHLQKTLPTFSFKKVQPLSAQGPNTQEDRNYTQLKEKLSILKTCLNDNITPENAQQVHDSAKHVHRETTLTPQTHRALVNVASHALHLLEKSKAL
jgi:hypothetical protein